MPVTYKDETYAEVLLWKADTRIQYSANPKSGKSYWRYKGYEKAKTVAESLEKGSYPQDLFFDYEHGYIKVLGGPRRKQPLDPKDECESWTKVDKMLAKMHHNWLLWKKTFKLADDLGVDRRQLTSDKIQAESTEVRAKRLAAAEMAKMILEDVQKKQRIVTDSDVTAVLRLWGFRENTTRQNVMQEGQAFVYSDTLGLVKSRDGSVLVTQATSEYPSVSKVLNQWLHDHVPEALKKFGCTSINVNASYAAKLHRDGNNVGPSMIKAFGKFTGGRLNYWGDDDKKLGPVEKMCQEGDAEVLDIRTNLALFDGNRGHSVEAFRGERFSLVWFCVGLYDRSNKKVRAELARCGFRLPTPESMTKARSLLGTPRGYAVARAQRTERANVLCWPSDEKREALGREFLTAARIKEAKNAACTVEKAEAEVCNDQEFVDARIKYCLLPDGRKGVRVFLVGASGGEKLVISADEEKKGVGRYPYEKVDGCEVGPPLSTHRIAEVRAWLTKVLKKEVRPTTKRCIRSSSAEEGDVAGPKRVKRARLLGGA